MPLTKEQLLVPRVLCIGTDEGKPNYPGSQLKTGDIITVGSLIQIGLQVFSASELLLSELCNQFPNCFKPLQWWELRTSEDMPEYVKFIHDPYIGEIVHVPSFEKGSTPFEFILGRPKLTIQHYSFCEPATREEYEEYLKQKEAQW